MSSFEKLHGKVQQFVYKQRWPSFRPMQDAAIEHILGKNGDLLICAPTASGKTEAAFFPIVSEIADDSGGSFRVLYISPLKALINDQFRRVDSLCQEVGVMVTRWHGDVSHGIKNKALKNPSGILLITPESLEAMLINKPALVRSAFRRLDFVVIDEVHSFVDSERGAQLLSVLRRIEEEAACHPIKVALSATVGNPTEVATWINSTKAAKVLSDDLWNQDIAVEGAVQGFTMKVRPENVASEMKLLLDPSYYQSIYLKFLNGKNLIFGNSKSKLEETAFLIGELAKSRNSKTEFLIHHGSLSKETRESAENEVKTSADAVSVFCTSTLEMGLDIGAIEKVGMIDPPWSVSGFAQRIGRSGRREGTSRKFEFFVLEAELDQNSGMADLLREDLVKSIAIVLLFQEKFKEPLAIKNLHYSTLAHQVLSFCAQKTGARFPQIYSTIFGSFAWTGGEGAALDLLNHLVENKFLHLDETDLYSPGKIGERFVGHYEFYSVFQTTAQWSVVTDSQVIGQIPVLGHYRTGDHILLGGRVWLIREVSESVKRLTVTPAKKGRVPIFSASFGVTHRRIHQKMREIYETNTSYGFLIHGGTELLAQGRQSFAMLLNGKDRATQTRFAIFEGSAIKTTISSLLQLCGIEHGLSECSLEVAAPFDHWFGLVEGRLNTVKSAEELAALIARERKIIEKFDHLLPEACLNISYAYNHLDLEGARAWFAKL